MMGTLKSCGKGCPENWQGVGSGVRPGSSFVAGLVPAQVADPATARKRREIISSRLR